MAYAIDHAIRACPFLHAVAEKDGVEVARRVATDPFRSAADAGRPPVLTEPATPAAFVGTYRAFHVGPGAIVPLSRAVPACPFAAAAAAAASRLPACEPSASTVPAEEQAPVEFVLDPQVATPRSCPHAASAAAAASAGAAAPNAAAPPRRANGVPPRAAATTAPFASLSLPFLGGLPDPADFFKRHRRPRGKQPADAKRSSEPPKPRPPRPPAAGKGGGPGPTTTAAPPGPSGPPPPPPPRPRPRARRPGPAKPRASTTSSSGHAPASSSSAAGGGGCPLRSLPVLGALVPLAANGVDLACPPAIIALRAAVARVPAVRSLRPRPLVARGAAVMAAGAVAAAPFGAWRVHLDKFSPGWFLAVHATIPFVAALRQATVMPRWALVLTLAGSVAGQLAGAALERARLAHQAAAAAAQPANSSRERRRPASPVILGACRPGKLRVDRGGRGPPTVVVA